MSFNLACILRESAKADPDKPLLHLGEISFSYAQVEELAGRVAGGLRAAGLQPGDKVAVQLPNVPQFLFAYFGILKAGMTMVPINPLLTAPEVAYHLTDSDARVLVTHEQFATPALAGAADAGQVPTYVVGDSGAPAGGRDFAELTAADVWDDLYPSSSDDTAVLVYTSGTTGKPKGAELTHFQLFMNCTTAGDLFGLKSEDVVMGVLPLFHVFGLSSVLNCGVRFGATLVLVPRFDVDVVLDAVEQRRVTVFPGVPTMYFALLQADLSQRDTSSLRAALSGGASIPGDVIRAFEEKVPGVVILEGYGLSETASTTTFNVSAEERRVLSIGKPIWGVEVRVVGEDGQELPPGPDHVGEVIVRGHNVTKGYYKRPEDTAEAIRDGWLHTGDLGHRDEDGYFFIVDRLKDLVIRGGFNVYPREVEEVLYEHPDVAEAAVIGKPDERLGEEVVAFVSLTPGSTTTPEDITAHCKERLAAYKYPREVHVLTALPMGATGKILKRDLRTDQ